MLFSFLLRTFLLIGGSFYRFFSDGFMIRYIDNINMRKSFGKGLFHLTKVQRIKVKLVAHFLPNGKEIFAAFYDMEITKNMISS